MRSIRHTIGLILALWLIPIIPATARATGPEGTAQPKGAGGKPFQHLATQLGLTAAQEATIQNGIKALRTTLWATISADRTTFISDFENPAKSDADVYTDYTTLQADVKSLKSSPAMQAYIQGVRDLLIKNLTSEQLAKLPPGFVMGICMAGHGHRPFAPGWAKSSPASSSTP